MGIGAVAISDVPARQIWWRMMNGRPLSQPIRGGVSSDGRLVFADDALRRLNHRAGGVEGGALAIPGLAALAMLTHQLKMRLSRSVRVADADEDLELWVEAQIEGEIARLSILSWRASAPHVLGSHPDPDLERPDGMTQVRFDAALRLVAATGELSRLLGQNDFGGGPEAILVRLLGDRSQMSEFVNAVHMRRKISAQPCAVIDGSITSVSGTPILSDGEEFSGYQIVFRSAAAIEPAPGANRPGVLFGRHLAPVLRQPLGRIIANAETIGNAMNGPIRENYATYAKDIASAARHLVALVDDLGDLEAVEQADFVTAKDRIELGDVARRVAGLLSLKAADHSIRIFTPDETQQVPAVAEFRRVLQILLNLVTNAIRYAPDGTEISIEIGTANDMALLRVSDQGKGIAPQDRERIFDKFERLGRSGDGGSGLGLYISRSLARAMDGELSVGDAPGGGAAFILTLPSQ
jgi:signal transduction histidine kinase